MTRSISKTLPCWFLGCFLSSSGSCDTTVHQKDAQAMPTDQERLRMMQWMRRVKRVEAEKNADDPGWVVARRLSHFDFAYVLQDLTGLPSTPSYPLPVDPANEQGFDNTGESLSVSPALIKKYLEIGRVFDYLNRSDEERKLCSFYLSIMDRMGVFLETFGSPDIRLKGV